MFELRAVCRDEWPDWMPASPITRGSRAHVIETMGDLRCGQVTFFVTNLNTGEAFYGDEFECERTDSGDAERKLLAEWEGYARTLADAGVIALPERLLERTVGLLDATAV